MSDAAPTPPTAAALFRRFFGLGCTAFGGPVVQIETLHREFAGDGRLVTSERFHRALAVYQALPGPEATEMCIWLGTVARGRLGGLLAGLGFALPGFVLMLTAAWLLQGGAAWPAWLQATIAGMQGGAVALLLRAARRLFVAGTRRQAIPVAIALAAAIGAFAQVPFAVALVAGGLALLTTGLPRRMALGANGGRGSPGLLLVVFVSWLTLGFWLAPGAPATDTAALAIAAGSADLGTLATTGLQAGLLTFGGAYTAIPFLQEAATGPAGWMTGEAMLSGIAIGGVLPTPMVMVGTWVGFAGGGLTGALLLTLGIFLPAFALPLLLHERLESLTAARSLHTFLDGVTAAVAGLVVATAVSMTLGHLDSQHTTGLASTMTAWLILWRWRHRLATPTAMLASGLVGLLLANVT